GSYLLAAVMNMRSFGPALEIAPHARVDDGLLDVALIGPDAKDALVTHLRRAANEGIIALPAFEVVRGARVRLRADGQWAHVDDEPRQLDAEVTIAVEPRAIRVLVPAP